MNACQAPVGKPFPLYQCHKQVRAVKIASIEPMIEGEGKVLIFDDGSRKYVNDAWLVRNPALKVGGYFVEYQEGDGYTSYSPAGPFEGGYTKIFPAHQQRVITEKAELDEKLSKLTAFYDTEIYRNLNPDEQARLTKQADIMAEYSCILGDRIAAF